MTALREGLEVDEPVYSDLYLHYSVAPIKVPQLDATHEILRCNPTRPVPVMHRRYGRNVDMCITFIC